MSEFGTYDNFPRCRSYSLKASYTGAPRLRSALQTIGVGGASAGVAFGIGRALTLLGGGAV